uniref:Uncharacterized protein n=1 Tax=Romanomermis culicivorax TaxID=13658 RepID=A0A915I6P8_ROMCU
MPIFDCNIAKLPPKVIPSSLTGPPAVADLMVLGTSTNEFLKLMLDDISPIAPISVEMTTPVHQPETETKEEAMNTSDKTLTNIPERASADAQTSIDVVPQAVDPSIYLATPAALPSLPMTATVAPARYIPPVHISHQYISDSQSAALAAALKAYGFAAPLPYMLFHKHHW